MLLILITHISNLYTDFINPFLKNFFYIILFKFVFELKLQKDRFLFFLFAL